MGCSPPVQDLVEGVSAPVARARVTLDEVWRETRLEDRHDGLLRDDRAMVENRGEHTGLALLPLLTPFSPRATGNSPPPRQRPSCELPRDRTAAARQSPIARQHVR